MSWKGDRVAARRRWHLGPNPTLYPSVIIRRRVVGMAYPSLLLIEILLFVSTGQPKSIVRQQLR